MVKLYAKKINTAFRHGSFNTDIFLRSYDKKKLLININYLRVV